MPALRVQIPQVLEPGNEELKKQLVSVQQAMDASVPKEPRKKRKEKKRNQIEHEGPTSDAQPIFNPEENAEIVCALGGLRF